MVKNSVVIDCSCSFIVILVQVVFLFSFLSLNFSFFDISWHNIFLFLHLLLREQKWMLGQRNNSGKSFTHDLKPNPNPLTLTPNPNPNPNPYPNPNHNPNPNPQFNSAVYDRVSNLGVGHILPIFDCESPRFIWSKGSCPTPWQHPACVPKVACGNLFHNTLTAVSLKTSKHINWEEKKIIDTHGTKKCKIFCSSCRCKAEKNNVLSQSSPGFQKRMQNAVFYPVFFFFFFFFYDLLRSLVPYILFFLYSKEIKELRTGWKSGQD